MKNQAVIFEQKGVSLIITFFIMIIILAVVLAITTLLYSEIKIIRNIGNSVVAFYAADSGAEKVLYYDRRIFPVLETGNASRGLCSMCDFNPIDNPDACPDTDDISGLDPSIYCNSCQKTALDDFPQDGCNPDVCDNCEITFDTAFDNKTYHVAATVSPDQTDPSFSAFEIKSKGSFSDVSRQLDIKSVKSETGEAINIERACANPSYDPDSEKYYIDILADVSATQPGDAISHVTAIIQNSLGDTINDNFSLLPVGGDRWQATWSTDIEDNYIVNLDAENTKDPTSHQILNNILPCSM